MCEHEIRHRLTIGHAPARATFIRGLSTRLARCLDADWPYDPKRIHIKTGQTGYKARRQKAKSLICMYMLFNIMGVMQH